MGYRLIVLTCLVLTGLLFRQAFAAPAITGVSGTVQDGQTVTISGSGFGDTGPNVVFFDSFEKGAVGQPLSFVEDSADIGEWHHPGDSACISVISSAYSISGGKSMQIDWRPSYGGGGGGGPWLYHPNVQESYVLYSWWQLIPLDRDVPGTNNVDGANWKWFWMGDHTDIDETGNWPPGSDYAGHQHDWNFDVNGYPDEWIIGPALGHDQGLPARNDAAFDGNSGYYESLSHHGEWLRVTVIMRNSTSNGAMYTQEVSSRGHITPFSYPSGMVTAHATDPWNLFILPGYGREDNNAAAFYDDVYIATGDGARARVEIGNEPTYSASTNLALVTPTAWGDTSITATVRQGQFDAEESAYLYVVHADGSVNATGYPVMIGAGAPAQAAGGRLSGSLSGGGVMR